MRSIGLLLVELLPSAVASRLRGSTRVARILRPLANRIVPERESVVEVRSGKAQGVRLAIFPRSEKYYWLGTYEPDVLNVITGRLGPGDTYWDVGSHVGYMVAVASRRVGPSGHVVAFEPNPENLGRLRRTLELNDLRNVTIRDVALSDHIGEAQFFLDDASSMGSLVPRSADGPVVSVRMSTIDDELKTLPFPDLIKIDVEGSETSVLAGAASFLGTRRSELIIEVLTDAQRKAVSDRLDGYRTSMLDGRNMLALPDSTQD